MPIATITSKHQITIPKEVRQRMNLHKGDRVRFEGAGGTAIRIKKVAASPKSDGSAVRFIKRGTRLSVSEMKQAARANAARSFKESSR